MKLLKIAAAAATGLALLGGTALADDKPVVGLIMKSLANEFFQNMMVGAEEHQKRRGDYELKAVGMQNETDFESQINAVENFITQGVDAIVVAPADSRAMVRPLKKAMEAGIVVVNFDVALDEEAKKQQGVELAFVGPDNRGGAKLAGDALGKKLGEGAKVVIIEGNPGADNATQRRLGFEDSVAEYKLDLLDSRTAHWETEEANQVFATMLTAHPDVQGVMAANDSMAIGVVKALESAGRTDIEVIGFDNIPAVGPMIEDGRMLATVDQFGTDMAANAIDMALDVVSTGEQLQGWVKTPIELVTAK
ncbi:MULTISPECIES: sugar ABC transporter substrate-binding protein [Stappiaceae]|jgi:ribose transport system substrate-binding protein|uniref:D-ribose-binding periplasmic protein n=2 Tax=Roseibium TaxID=150830 RepID=A0A0M6Y8H5_9HYPH|nr:MULTISPECIES: sugar ABC transporter substrate-binding protein [Stappiaceae]MCR9280122.1 sugar ABC transporter substrate-binding protein [Paracoccaceae bacterium]MEC9404172.1 sugar ABC transporter substrate-binding protein [Pseudomonadota bacterium]AQQ02587.1 LacI family transcriptional regulator [Roseibium aggregatum]ERP98703.1 ribose ABC transporter [Labrenzia sp. C1B10]ERS01027.1 ribose ABC transporter [Labrenzia sp. C1B70]